MFSRRRLPVQCSAVGLRERSSLQGSDPVATKMSLLKKMWKNNLKHKKLYEEWSEVLSDSLVNSEPTEKRFRLKYVGAFPAEIANSPTVTTKTIELAISNAKSGKKKLRTVDLTVSPKGIFIEDPQTFEKILDISIFKISYCSADGVHSNVFAFIALGANDILECHVFMCPKKKLARAASCAAAANFEAAHKSWQMNQQKLTFTEEKLEKKPETCIGNTDIGELIKLDCSFRSSLDPFEEEVWAPSPDITHLSRFS